MTHEDDGYSFWDGYGGEATIYWCSCGQNFTEKSELLDHIAEQERTVKEWPDVL
jgi:hypothetical protein